MNKIIDNWLSYKNPQFVLQNVFIEGPVCFRRLKFIKSDNLLYGVDVYFTEHMVTTYNFMAKDTTKLLQNKKDRGLDVENNLDTYSQLDFVPDEWRILDEGIICSSSMKSLTALMGDMVSSSELNKSVKEYIHHIILSVLRTETNDSVLIKEITWKDKNSLVLKMYLSLGNILCTPINLTIGGVTYVDLNRFKGFRKQVKEHLDLAVGNLTSLKFMED